MPGAAPAEEKKKDQTLDHQEAGPKKEKRPTVKGAWAEAKTAATLDGEMSPSCEGPRPGGDQRRRCCLDEQGRRSGAWPRRGWGWGPRWAVAGTGGGGGRAALGKKGRVFFYIYIREGPGLRRGIGDEEDIFG